MVDTCPSLNDYGPEDFATESLYKIWLRGAIASLEDELEKANTENKRLQQIEKWVLKFIEHPEIMWIMIEKLQFLKPDEPIDNLQEVVMGLSKGVVVEMITSAKAAHVLIREQMDNIDDEDAEDVLGDLQSAITRLQNELDESHEPVR